MKAVEFAHAEDAAFRKVRDFAPREFLDLLTEDDHETEVRVHFQGDEDQLCLLEIKEIPNGKSVLHAHEKDEIFYVLDGEMSFGKRTCTAGDSIRIRGGTLYSFVTGPRGCRYLKFTGSADSSFITEEQYRQTPSKSG